MNTQVKFMGVKLTRIAAHLLFWAAVYLFFAFMYSVKTTFSIAARNGIFYMPVHMGYFYTVAYWLMPQYLIRGRYVAFAGLMIVLACIVALLGRVVDILISDPYIIGHVKNVDWDYIEESKLDFWTRLIIPFNFANSVKVTNMMVWVALGVKLFKLWYERKQAALQAELKALKAQVHPHFLFNTLNNLYALTLNNSPKAPGVVIGLSDMLRYMLYECNADKVNLKKEVLMLQHYIGLEKIRYEDRLDLNFTITGELDDKLIAPLVLLPLVENAFKHGTGEKVGATWINITLEVVANKLKFKISNSKPDVDDEDKHHGFIGLQNIKKRLELLYPASYQLKIMDEDEVFLAVLELELQTDPQPTAKPLVRA
ncbi:sensor histidine kinase [Mucilaginibacter sp. AW1-3]